MHHRRQRLYDAQQRERLWRAHDQPAGERGCGRRHGARRDRPRGGGGAGRDSVSRSRAGAARRRRLPASTTFHGAGELDAFLRAHRNPGLPAAADAATPTGILNLALLRKLKRDGAAGGAFLINAGRGPLAGRCRHRRSARRRHARRLRRSTCFPQEPLPPESPLWTHPKVTITPHNAGDISPRVFAPHVIAQIERFERGLPLDNADRPRARLLMASVSRSGSVTSAAARW